MSDSTEKCPDCQVSPGSRHKDGCDVARCTRCGKQALQCGIHRRAPVTRWTGQWPGQAECEEFGWYSYWCDPEPGEEYGKWVRCDKDHPKAGADLNRLGDAALYGQVAWSEKKERYVLTLPSLR